MSSVAPKRSLGQHFLVDRNVLGVIERLAHPEPTDVALEVGPGLGVLTTFLADRVRLVHAVELDRSLEPALRDAIGARANVELHFADALALDPEALEPPPTKLVANLPYNVATPIVAETLLRAPTLGSWCVMVQREVADRFFAEPGTKAYGAVSVLVRLHAVRTGFHPVARTVFRPVPNVDSALVAFDRIPAPAGHRENPPGRPRRVRAPSQDACELPRADRRRGPRGGRSGARRDRPAAGRPRGGARAGRVRRARNRARALSEQLEAAAPAKLNLALVVGPLRLDGKHEVVTVLERLALADEVALREADATAVEGFADDTLVGAALEGICAAAGSPRRFAVRLTKRIPVAAGLGGGSSDAAAALALANRALGPDALSARALHDLAADLGADVPFFLQDRPAARDRRRHDARAARAASRLQRPPRAAGRRREVVDARGLRGVRRARRRQRLRRPPAGASRRSRADPLLARPRGSPGERPRLVTARRRAARARRVPRRRVRRGAGRLRALRDRREAERAGEALAARPGSGSRHRSAAARDPSPRPASRYRPVMLEESKLRTTEHGLVPTGEGWFVLNARDAPWNERDGRGFYCEFEGFEGASRLLRSSGSTSPSCGRASRWRCTTGRPTRRTSSSSFGEAVAIVEGEERPLRRWDLLHCPAKTEHTIVGAGDTVCVVVAVGARDRSTGPEWGAYTVADAARRHGAGVERETTDAREAYARFAASSWTTFRDEMLPD